MTDWGKKPLTGQPCEGVESLAVGRNANAGQFAQGADRVGGPGLLGKRIHYGFFI
jgi:hypothetical protein